MSPSQEHHPNGTHNGHDDDVSNLHYSQQQQQAHRFPAWMALTVFSVVCLVALVTHNKPGEDAASDDRGKAETWCLAVCCVSMILSCLAVIAYLFLRAPFVGQMPEAAALGLLVTFWAAGLPVLMNPANEICLLNEGAGNGNGGLVIINANLYFFSWLSFAAVLYLTASVAQEMAGVAVTNTPPQMARWLGLTASSLVVMGSAARALKTDDECAINGSLESCKRTKFAIAVGTCSFVLAALVTFLQQQQARLQLWVETAFTTLLLTLWCFGVGFVTFGQDTPGATISNLFFACWISFILVVFLFARNFRETVAARQQQTTSTDQTTANGGGDTEMGSNPTVGAHDF